MERSARRVLLVHALDNMDLAKLQLMGHQMLIITKDNGGALIKDLIEGKGAPASGDLPQEKVIIFNGYADEDLKQSVGAIRSSFKDKPIIAAVTDNSYNWTFEFLLTEHLIKDRDWNLRSAKDYRENLIRENQAAAGGASKQNNEGE